MKLRLKIKQKKEIYCWNCKKVTRIEEGYTEYAHLRRVEDFGGKLTSVTYCSECLAILSPKRKRCDECGKYRRAFRAGIQLHGGGTFIPLCRRCMSEVYIPFVEELERKIAQKSSMVE